jgi:sugar phosphate isomerase/epimerase
VSARVHSRTGIDSLATARQIYDAIDDGELGVMFDAWHFARSGGTIDQLVDLPPGMITIVQTLRSHRIRTGRAYVPMAGRLLPGKGDLPLVE